MHVPGKVVCVSRALGAQILQGTSFCLFFLKLLSNLRSPSLLNAERASFEEEEVTVVESVMENEWESKPSPTPIISAPHKKAPLRGIEVGKNRLDLIALDALLEQERVKAIKDAI